MENQFGGENLLDKMHERMRLRTEAARKSTSGIVPYDYQLKLLLVGQVSVGKTALLIRFVDEEFTPTFVSTVGIDFRCKYMMIGEEKVRLQIWDTAGQERFRAIVQAYYRSAVGICLVYDVTQRATFDSLRTWYNNIKEHASSEAVLVLIGNKSDCEPEERRVTEEEGRRAAADFGAIFFETSAKSGANVNEAFCGLALKCRDVLFEDSGDENREQGVPTSSSPSPADPSLRLVDLNGGEDTLASKPPQRGCC